MTTLHITNGDCAAATLRRIVDGPVTIAADVLHEGPCPPIEGEAWHEVRARVLAPPGQVDAVKASLMDGDRRIAEACRQRNDIVLWFEHDLFDQLALIRTLDLLARLMPASDGARSGVEPFSGPDGANLRAWLICIDAFPGVERFIGLGQLTAGELATLIGTGVPVTRDHQAIAARAWTAFRSPDPRGILAIPESRALPYLRPALRRFLAEYPSAANGLSRTEALALDALMAGGTTAGALFVATQAHEAAPFMGDSTFFEIVARLASCRVPLVTLEAQPGEGDPSLGRVGLTAAGREVLAGRADHVRLNGIDCWRGGTHLVGVDRSPWRWHAREERLVS